MLRYFLIFDQICIFCYQFEPIFTNLQVICCWHAVFELKTGKILPKRRKFWEIRLKSKFPVSKVKIFQFLGKINLPYSSVMRTKWQINFFIAVFCVSCGHSDNRSTVRFHFIFISGNFVHIFKIAKTRSSTAESFFLLLWRCCVFKKTASEWTFFMCAFLIFSLFKTVRFS